MSIYLIKTLNYPQWTEFLFKVLSTQIVAMTQNIVPIKMLTSNLALERKWKCLVTILKNPVGISTKTATMPCAFWLYCIFSVWMNFKLRWTNEIHQSLNVRASELKCCCSYSSLGEKSLNKRKLWFQLMQLNEVAMM